MWSILGTAYWQAWVHTPSQRYLKKKVFLVHSQVAYRGIYVHIFVCVVLIHVGYKLMVENTRSESTLFGICVWVGAWALSGDRYTSEKSYIKIGD